MTTAALTLDEIRSRLFLRVGEVAQLMDTDPRTVRRGIENGDIPAVRTSNTIRVPVPAFLALCGIAPEHTEAGPSQDPATATDSPSPLELRHVDGRAPAVAPASNVHPIRSS